MLMTLLQAAPPVFSLTKEVTVFAILVGVVIALVVFIDLMYPDEVGQDQPSDDELFTKIEEYRNDFPEPRVFDFEAARRQLSADPDRNRRGGSDHNGGTDR